ncbi:MAG: hypothetical protein ACRCYA_04095 [Cetobacterium sp.]|uniref:hypothetical protein n=1 Tax=Cetobacterium sp. TaxID=2071632 RepID=UPI003F39541B
MAILQGISGLQFGDADGGTIALSIDRRVLRILSGGRLSFMTATIGNLDGLKTGTI